MAQKLGLVLADFQTQLSVKATIGATTATIQSATDSDGVSLPSGRYFFTLDSGSRKEHISCDLSGTSLSNIKSLSRQGTETTGFAREHKVGASVKHTDFGTILFLALLLRGALAFTSTDKIKYDAEPTFVYGNHELVTYDKMKDYADGIALAGAPDASTTVKGVAEEATQAEIDAATGAGGTTARLFVNPSTLATSIYGTRLPTANEKSALVGNSGTAVSSSNKYVDNSDTATTATANKVVRALGTGLIDASYIPNQKLNFTAGTALTAGQALSLSAYGQTDGGIVFDAKTGTSYAGTTNQSMSHTVGAGSNRLLIVAVSAGSAPSGVTYNSVAMTLVDSISTRIYIYRLVAPATGANNVVVTGTSIQGILATSYRGVDQTTPIEATAKTSGSATSLTQNITTLSNGALINTSFTGQGLSGTQSGSFTYSTKYSSAMTALNPNTAQTLTPQVFSADSGKINEAQTISVSGSFSGSGGGSPLADMILVSVKPFTTASLSVVPTNTSTITVNEPFADFIGFADSSVSAGASVSVTVGSIVTGLSGLTSGTRYYLQSSNGTIASTVSGDYSKFVGTAISSTTLLIQKEITHGVQIARSANYTYTAETDGFILANAPASTTITITVGGSVVTTATSPGGTVIQMTAPVRRGQTYIVSTGGTNVKFISSI